MRAIISFFSNLTLGKKLLLLLTPFVSTIVSMKAALLGLFILILVDLLTGIRKNLHTRGIDFNPLNKSFYRSIKSYLLRQTLTKTYEYVFGIIAIVVIEALVFGDFPITFMSKTFRISELAVLVPSTVEVWSIFENLEAVSGNNLLKVIKKLLPAPLASIFNKSNTKE